MSHCFLIVGKSFGDLIKAIEDRGDTWVLLKDSRAQSSDSRIHTADFSNDQVVCETAQSLDQKIDGVITTYERYIVIASKIANALGLPALPLDAARACTDKELMRDAFSKAPEPISPDFKVVASLQEAQRFAENHEFPLILKPASLAKSLLVLKCNDATELEEGYAKISSEIDAVYKKYSPFSKPKIIIEEFMQGSIHSVDAFVDGDGEPHVLEHVVDYQTGHDIGFEDNFHYSRILPSELSLEDQAQLRHVAKLGCRALGIKNSPAHIEIIMTKNGPRIVEIGARNGGYRQRMHLLANGLSMYNINLDLQLGRTFKATASKQEACAVLELFPKVPGEYVGIEHIQGLKKLDSLVYLSVKAKPGKFVGKAGDGYKMCAVVILHNSDAYHFKKDLAFVNHYVRVVTS